MQRRNEALCLDSESQRFASSSDRRHRATPSGCSGAPCQRVPLTVLIPGTMHVGPCRRWLDPSPTTPKGFLFRLPSPPALLEQFAFHRYTSLPVPVSHQMAVSADNIGRLDPQSLHVTPTWCSKPVSLINGLHFSQPRIQQSLTMALPLARANLGKVNI